MTDRPILMSFSPSDPKWRAAAARIKVPIDEYVGALSAGNKICCSCRKALPRTADFFGTERGRFRSRCHECRAADKRDHYRRTKPEERARQIRYQRENREKLYAYNANWSRRRHAALRCETIEAYGGCCACCGEREPIFLDLDHIKNDGREHRREVRNNTTLMLQLRAAGWPRDRVQLLCSNCNQGKVRNGGVCPHQGGRNG